jgi:hypothetical protein
MENEFLSVLSRCPWVQNARLLAKPEQPETVETVLNDMIAFRYKEGYKPDEIEALILRHLDNLGFSKMRCPVEFNSQSEGIEPLFSGVFTDGNLTIRIAVSWHEQDDRLVVIYIKNLY